MDKGMIVGAIVVLVLVGVAIGVSVVYPSAPEIYVEPAVIKVKEPSEAGAVSSLLNVDNTVYLAYASMTENKATFYITHVSYAGQLALGKPVHTISGKFVDGKITKYENSVYFAMETENESTVLITFEKSGATFKFSGERYIYGSYPVNVFANENGVYLLAGAVSTNTVKLLNIETGRAIYTMQAKMVYASYLITYGSKEFLTVYFKNDNTYSVRVVEFSATTSSKEIYTATAHLWGVFAMQVGDKEYLYMAGNSTTLCKINLSSYSSEKYNVGEYTGIYYSPSQRLFIGLKGRNYSVSTDGIHFTPFFYLENGYVILMHPGSVIINGNNAYTLKYKTNVGLYIMDFDLTGVREF